MKAGRLQQIADHPDFLAAAHAQFQKRISVPVGVLSGSSSHAFGSYR
jgi:hypothetical protein